MTLQNQHTDYLSFCKVEGMEQLECCDFVVFVFVLFFSGVVGRQFQDSSGTVSLSPHKSRSCLVIIN